MGRLSGFRYREITKKLRSFGFVFDRQAAGHAGDMPEGTLRAILKQAGVDVDDFLGS
jgi:predicted RNA binding protein YcfA (HicA-like mRNA interferase family)